MRGREREEGNEGVENEREGKGGRRVENEREGKGKRRRDEVRGRKDGERLQQEQVPWYCESTPLCWLILSYQSPHVSLPVYKSFSFPPPLNSGTYSLHPHHVVSHTRPPGTTSLSALAG